MITKCFRSGNSVANYRVCQDVCETCHGEGILTVNYDELREYVNSTTLLLSEAKDVVRRWRSTETIICDTCNGAGEVESWG